MMEPVTPKEASVEEVYVKSEPSLEGYVKSEPIWDDACVQDELSSSDARVKAEPLCSDVCEDESSSSDACVEDEPSCPEAAGARGASEAAAAARLYADHVVKDELVLGPEVVEPRRGLCAATGQSQKNKFSGTSKTYQCSHCSYSAARKASLASHERRHTGRKLLVHDHYTGEMSCKYGQCIYTCAQKRVQKRVHDYRCDYCSYASACKRNLKVHVQTHTGEKRHKCGQCSFASNQRANLVTHERIHTGEKPYKCDQCSYASTQRTNLVTHKRRHTGEKPYKCGQCSYATYVKCHLKVHKKRYTGEKSYKCVQCSYSCNEMKWLQVHQKEHADHDHNYARRESTRAPRLPRATSTGGTCRPRREAEQIGREERLPTYRIQDSRDKAAASETKKNGVVVAGHSEEGYYIRVTSGPF